MDGGRAGVRRRDLFGAAGGFLAVELLALGCAPDEPPLRPGQVTVAAKDLVAGRRLIVIVAGNPVELSRSANGITARSLRCTHWGCVVRWREAERAYVCPCHEGRYDENGGVLAGPPPLSLRAVPVIVSKDRLTVG